MGYYAGWLLFSSRPFSWRVPEGSWMGEAPPEGASEQDADGWYHIPTGHTLWEPLGDGLRFHRVTRLSKITDEERRGGVQHPDAFERAAICFNHVAVANLSASQETRELSWVAPRIVETAHGVHQDMMEATPKGDVISFSVSLAHEADTHRSRIPSHREMRAHNAALDRPDLLDYVRTRHHIILDTPLLWARPSDIARWFEANNKPVMDAREAAGKDPAAYALFSGWEAQLTTWALREQEGADLRVVFIFPEYGWSQY